ncbi:hypothetical protein LTR12_003003 [Friedmanniomyces endolithicus]|nr:hypothetical protein LTR12_003003 [Friedmanniomyces endolithicus]
MGKLWGTHRKKSKSSGLLDWNTFDQGIIPTSYFPHGTPLLGSAAGYSGWPGNSGEMVLQQQQQQETNYEPSQSLRDLITSRLIQQQKCLKHEQKRLATLVETSCEAKRVSDAGKKSPGDQQISAASVQQATVGATLGYQDPMMMSRNPLGIPRAYNNLSRMTRAYAAMGTPFSPFAGSGGEMGVESPVLADALALLYQPSEADMLGLQAAMLSTDRNVTVKLLLAAPVVDEESDSESNSEEGEQESDSEDGDSSRAVTQRTREAQAPRGNMPQPSGSAAPSPQPGQPSWGFGSPGAGGHMQQPNLGNAPPTQHLQPAQMGGQMLQQPMGAPPGSRPPPSSHGVPPTVP